MQYIFDSTVIDGAEPGKIPGKQMDRVNIESKYADKNGQLMVIKVNGHIDQSNSYMLQKLFEDLLNGDCFKVVVDFGKLDYMSSAGWGVFVGEIKRFRDNGGDIKLANMNADIYDVFQMLEFYHLLEDYPTVQEASESFLQDDATLDLIINSTKDGIDNQSQNAGDNNVSQDTSKQEIIEFIPGESKKDRVEAEKHDIFEQKLTKSVDLKQLPLPQKILTIIAQDPTLSILGIKKKLETEHFGNTKINIIKLALTLIELDLNSKDKRYRYYRSC